MLSVCGAVGPDVASHMRQSCSQYRGVQYDQVAEVKFELADVSSDAECLGQLCMIGAREVAKGKDTLRARLWGLVNELWRGSGGEGTPNWAAVVAAIPACVAANATVLPAALSADIDVIQDEWRRRITLAEATPPFEFDGRTVFPLVGYITDRHPLIAMLRTRLCSNFIHVWYHSRNCLYSPRFGRDHSAWGHITEKIVCGWIQHVLARRHGESCLFIGPTCNIASVHAICCRTQVGGIPATGKRSHRRIYSSNR